MIMVLNWKMALPIGIAIGVAITLPVAFAFFQNTTNNSLLDSIDCERIECFDFQFTGNVESISADSLTIIQSLNESESEHETAITWRIGPSSPLFWCTGDGPECAGTTYDMIPEGSPVCVYARLNPDGSFDVSRFFFNTVCTLQVPPSA